MIPRPANEHQEIDLDRLHDILRNEVRRTIIRTLADTDSHWLTVDELARDLNHLQAPNKYSRKQRLRNDHLQLLHQYHIIEFDDDRDRIRADKNHHLAERIHTAAATEFHEHT